MTSFTVASTADLTAILPFAQAGDTILLAPGTYDPIALKNINTSNLTITSADMFRPAFVNTITLNACSGITFSNLEVRAVEDTTNTQYAVSILNGCSNINVDHLKVHGSLDNDPSNDSQGMLIRSSTNVSVTNSEFWQLHSGVAHLDDSNLTISGNSFHDLAEDGVRGGGTSDMTVSHNTFYDFYYKTGIHPDAIQFWTVNTTASAHDITITDNAIVRGAGGQIQGIFVQDNVGNLPYQHVTISGNLISGGMYNGITVQDGQDVNITNNIIQGFSDMKSWIRLEHVTGGNITGNSENTILDTVSNSGLVETNNTTLPLASDNGRSAVDSWLSQEHLTTRSDAASGAAAIVAPGNTGVRLDGTAGNDLIFGGSGNDLITTSIGNDTVNGKQGDDTITGGPGDDWLYGGQGNDFITAGSGPTMIFGNLGNDTIIAGHGADTIRGGQGNDVIVGGPGPDWISGDRGDDTITGGTGADTFHSSSGAGLDIITNFDATKGDHIQLDPGTFYTLRQSGADTIVDMGGGDQVVLQNTVLANLPVGWIFVG